MFFLLKKDLNLILKKVVGLSMVFKILSKHVKPQLNFQANFYQLTKQIVNFIKSSR